MNNEAIDLLSQMLVFDHAKRITPKDAMHHPYFAPVVHSQMKDKDKDKDKDK